MPALTSATVITEVNFMVQRDTVVLEEKELCCSAVAREREIRRVVTDCADDQFHEEGLSVSRR